jgi:hypothetical protein
VTSSELHAVIEAYVRGKVPQQAVLTSLGDVAQALVEVGNKMGFAMPGIQVRLQHAHPGQRDLFLAGDRL